MFEIQQFVLFGLSFMTHVFRCLKKNPSTYNPQTKVIYLYLYLCFLVPTNWFLWRSEVLLFLLEQHHEFQLRGSSMGELSAQAQLPEFVHGILRHALPPRLGWAHHAYGGRRGGQGEKGLWMPVCLWFIPFTDF